jgi:hypothetical protein
MRRVLVVLAAADGKPNTVSGGRSGQCASPGF